MKSSIQWIYCGMCYIRWHLRLSGVESEEESKGNTREERDAAPGGHRSLSADELRPSMQVQGRMSLGARQGKLV